MKKTWVKRENIYYKPFYKDKSKLLLLGIFTLGIIFFIYQAFSINKLPNDNFHTQTIHEIDNDILYKINDSFNFSESSVTVSNAKLNIIRGIRLFDFAAYKPNFHGKFRCLESNKEIEFFKVNDDYCDCPLDGSDEPSTNACALGKFYCKYQKRHITGRGRDVYIPSSRINDGICDCCDGSDEWLNINNIKCPKNCL